jgi:hypothetical protein
MRCDLPARPRLAFIETAEHARRVLDDWTNARLDAVIALEPEGAWALSMAGRPYLTLEDGYDPRALCDLANPILMRQEKWADTIDAWLWRRLPEFAEQGFRPARLHLYWLKIVFDSLLMRAYPLEWAFERWHPSWIWHPGPAAAQSGFGWDLMFRQSLYPAVLRVVADRFGVEASLPEEPARSLIETGSSRAPHWMERPSAIEWLARRSRTIRRKVRGPWSGNRSSRIIASDAYDMEPVWREAGRSGIALDSWAGVVERHRKDAGPVSSTAICEGMRTAWTEAVETADILGPASTDTCDLRAAARDRVHFWWQVLVPEQWNVYRAVRDSADPTPSAVAVASVGDHVERGIFAAYRSRGARTFIYQHGGFVGACECPPWDCNDLWLADYELTYGPATTTYFAERATRYVEPRAVPITVGSSRLDSWRRTIRRGRRSRGRPRVLLVPNVIPRNARYFDAGTTPDVMEADLQLALVEVAADFPDYEFIFKAFPYPDQQGPAIQLASRSTSNCRVVADRPLPELVARADFIVSCFASTALLEALMSDRTILVLVDPRFVRMHADARRLLERRAHVASHPEELLTTYRRLLAAHDFGPIARPDDAFLREFGTHLNDGRSAERAWSAISAPFSQTPAPVEICRAPA